jgi:Heterokaryon incompatibility protein (HET)
MYKSLEELEKIRKNIKDSFVQNFVWKSEKFQFIRLKELIQKAKEGRIPWSYEVTLDSWLKVVNKNLQHILPENWDRITYTYPTWSKNALGDDVTSQIKSSNKLMKKDVSGNWKFVNEDILEKYKKYTNSEKELKISWGGPFAERKKIKDITLNDTIYGGWTDDDLTTIMGNGLRENIFKGESGTFQSKDALIFLQSIIGDYGNHVILYQLGQTYKLEEWKHDDVSNFEWDLRDSKEVIEGIAKNLWAAPEPSKKTNEQDAQKWLDKNYPTNGTCANSEDKENKGKKRENIVNLNISSENLIGELDLSDFVNLKELICSNNQLTKLDLTNCKELTKLDCSKNLKLANVLECLPLSLQEIECDQKIREELAFCGNNLRFWQISHSELMKKVGRELVTSSYENSPLIVVDIPEEFKSSEKQEPSIDYKVFENYSDFALLDFFPLSWENHTISPLKSEQLPLRLYNLKDKRVEETKNRKDINNYFALSYTWGDKIYEKESNLTITKIDGKTYSAQLTLLGAKALKKIETFIDKHQTNIGYVWIDNYCINQGDEDEKGKEVAGQKKYYNNATATLVAVNAKIGKRKQESDLEWAKHIIRKIVTSPWFTRVWTFQEGLLSKQTIFMFDDGIVDGRILSRVWLGVQKTDGLIKLNNNILATTLGWNYDSEREKTVNLGLIESLTAVSNRQKTVVVDGIYAILGLLPYGDKVNPGYKKKVCQHNEKEQEDASICKHNEQQKAWPVYNKKDLEKALSEVMKLAIKINPHEALSWKGDRLNELELWQVPQIQEDDKTKEFTIDIRKFLKIESKSGSLEINPQGVKLIGEITWNDNYVIVSPNEKLIVESKSFIISVPRYDDSLPIEIKESDSIISEEKHIFIDMVNKEVIVGEQAITDYPFYIWLKDVKKITLEQISENNDLKQLKKEFQDYQTNQLETKIEVYPPQHYQY